MKYSVFEDIISPERMQRYLVACNGNTRKAMALYRYNIKLSQELLALIGINNLRNRIAHHEPICFGNITLIPPMRSAASEAPRFSVIASS